MELFFGKVDFNEFDNVDPSECFKFKDNHYWYKAVLDEEQICFYDTCGRHFPLAIENVKEADTVLFAARTLYEAHQEAALVIDRAEHKVHSLLDFWEKN